MKKTTFTLLLSFSCCWLAAQCPAGDVTFSTQGQIDSFLINYPGCIDIPGNVTIRGVNITNLNGLLGITSIGGNLSIGKIGSFLGTPLYLGNDSLPSLAGLDSLHTIGGSLFIFGNDMLFDLIGLGHLVTVGADVEIFWNDSLTHLTGLEKITSIPGTLSIGRFILGGGTIHPRGNPVLMDLNGLINLHSVGEMTILRNDALVSLAGLNNLESAGSVGISGNASLTNLAGLEKIAQVFSISINENDALTSLTGLESLDSLLSLTIGSPPPGKQVNDWGNDALPNLTGLEKLVFIENLVVYANESLESLCGLNENATVNYLEVSKNPLLATCHVESICHYLATNPVSMIIENNAPGCNSPLEVETSCAAGAAACASGSGNGVPEMVQVNVFPNPAGDFLQIQISDPENWQISLFDFQGRQMFRQVVSGSQIIEVKNWPSGIYTLRAVSGGRAFSGKIVKQ